MRNRISAWIIAGLFALGCEPIDSTGGAGGSGPVDPAQKYCNAVGPAYCEALFACCTIPESLGSDGGTLDGCLDRWKNECPLWVASEVGPLLADGRSVLDDAQLNTCVQTLAPMKGGGAACVQPPRVVMSGICWGSFRGQVMPGEPCNVANTDISFVECLDGTCEQGICKPFRQTGDSCAPLTFTCNRARGETCVFDGTNAVCAPPTKLGEACTPLKDPADPNPACEAWSCTANKVCEIPPAHFLCIGD